MPLTTQPIKPQRIKELDMSTRSINQQFTAIARILFVATSILVLTSSVQANGLGFRGALVSLSNGTRVAQVQSVAQGSLGQKMGLRQGDNIISINGFFPGNASWNQQAIRSDNGRVTVVVNRFGNRITLSHRTNSGANNLARRVSGRWYFVDDGALMVATFTKQGRFRLQAANSWTGLPVGAATYAGRWKVQGKTLLAKSDGEVNRSKIIKLNHETMVLVEETGHTVKFFKNWSA